MLRNASFKSSFLTACLCLCALITMHAATIARSSITEITVDRARERAGLSSRPLVMFESKSQAPLDGFENHGPGAPGGILLAGTNDNFADAQSLSGFSGTVTGSNVGYTREVGEPSHSHLESSESAWYVWQAPDKGSATFTTKGSTFDTAIAVYTGSSLSTLVQVAANSNESDYPQIVTSRVTFRAVKGTTYYIAVTGESPRGAGFTQGTIYLGWNLATVDTTPPVFNTSGVADIIDIRDATQPCPVPVSDFSLFVRYSVRDDFTDWPNFRVSQSPVAGTLIGPGVTPVTIMAQDEAGNIGSTQGQMIVSDYVPPTATATWTPLGQMQKNHGRFRADFSAKDNCPATPTVSAKLLYFFSYIINDAPITFEATGETSDRDEEIIKINYKEGKVTLIGQDESVMRNLLASLATQGGISLTKGQEIEFFLDKQPRYLVDKKNYKVVTLNGETEYTFKGGVLVRVRGDGNDMLMAVVATDESGSQASANAAPPFDFSWIKSPDWTEPPK